MSSGSELRYLVDLAFRVECMEKADAQEIERGAGQVVRALQSLIAFREQHLIS